MLERFADRTRLQAGALVAFGLMVPLAFPFGAAAGVLTTLRRGVVDGVVVCGAALTVVALLLAAAGGSLYGLAWLGLVLAACVSMAHVLRQSASLNLAVQTGIGIAVLVLAGLLAAVPDQASAWRALFEAMLDRMMAQGAAITRAERDLWLQAVPFDAMTGLVLGTLLVLAWIALFLGRSWQARLSNPGGFRREFHGLALGRTLALASAVVFVAFAVVPRFWLLSLSALLMHVWILQGLAYLHWTVAQFGGGIQWLVISYGVIAFFWLTKNPLAVTLPLVGLVGELFAYRAFVGRWIKDRRGGGD